MIKQGSKVKCALKGFKVLNYVVGDRITSGQPQRNGQHTNLLLR